MVRSRNTNNQVAILKLKPEFSAITDWEHNIENSLVFSTKNPKKQRNKELRIGSYTV